jgi:opacity protein-like surface antigen
MLGCAALCLLAEPATAGEGLYLGLGAGWDGQNNATVDQLAPPFQSGTVVTNDGLLIAGTLGYKLPEIPLRLEFESGYDWHSVNSFQGPAGATSASGHSNVASELVNALYDFPIAPGWNLYGGGGVGEGHVYFAPNFTSDGSEIARTDQWGFMWQGIAGASFEIAPDAELFVDYRYRDAEAHGTAFTPSVGPVGTHALTENVVLAGVRFYMFPGMDAPPGAY